MYTASSLIRPSGLMPMLTSTRTETPNVCTLQSNGSSHHSGMGSACMSTPQTRRGRAQSITPDATIKTSHCIHSRQDSSKKKVGTASELPDPQPGGSAMGHRYSYWHGSGAATSTQLYSVDLNHTITSGVIQCGSIGQREYEHAAGMHHVCQDECSSLDMRETCQIQPNVGTVVRNSTDCDGSSSDACKYDDKSAEDFELACRVEPVNQSQNTSACLSQSDSRHQGPMNSTGWSAGLAVCDGSKTAVARDQTMLLSTSVPALIQSRDASDDREAPASIHSGGSSHKQPLSIDCDTSVSGKVFDAQARDQSELLELGDRQAISGNSSRATVVEERRAAAPSSSARRDQNQGRYESKPAAITTNRQECTLFGGQLDEDDAVLAAVIQDLLDEEHADRELPIVEVAPAVVGARQSLPGHGNRQCLAVDMVASHCPDESPESETLGACQTGHACEAKRTPVQLHAAVLTLPQTIRVWHGWFCLKDPD